MAVFVKAHRKKELEILAEYIDKWTRLVLSTEHSNMSMAQRVIQSYYEEREVLILESTGKHDDCQRSGGWTFGLTAKKYRPDIES